MINFNGQIYRNLEEQVQKNTSDIEAIRASGSFLGAKIVGQVDTAIELPDASTYVGTYGDCYAVGTSRPYKIYALVDSTEGSMDNEWFYLGYWPVAGEKGDTGEAGADGANGTHWYIVEGAPTGTANEGDCALNVLSGNVYYYEDNWELEGNIKGPKGDKGAKGDKGNTGAKGDKGDTGAQGPQGNVGPCPSILAGTVNTQTGIAGDTAGCTIDVREVGTDNLAYAIDFAFTIPAGAKGAKGDKGDTGAGIDTWSALDITAAPKANTLTAGINGIEWDVKGKVNYGSSSTDEITAKIRVPIRPASDNTFLNIATDVNRKFAEIRIDPAALGSEAGYLFEDDFNDALTEDLSFIQLEAAASDLATGLNDLGVNLNALSSEVAIIDGELTQATTDIDICEASITATNSNLDLLEDRVEALEPKAAVRLINNYELPTNDRIYTFDLPSTGVAHSNELKAFRRIVVIVKQTQVAPANKTAGLYSRYNDSSILLSLLPAGQGYNTSVGSARYIVYDINVDDIFVEVNSSGHQSGSSGPLYSGNTLQNPNSASILGSTKLRLNIGTSGDVFPEGTTLTVWYIRK